MPQTPVTMATRKPRTPLAAIVLAAGKGTRMKSITAKVLHPLGGRPLVWYAVRRALEAGASPVVVVVGHQAAAVEAALRAALPDAPLRFALQADQKGTAHAVLAAKPALRGPPAPPGRSGRTRPGRCGRRPGPAPSTGRRRRRSRGRRSPR